MPVTYHVVNAEGHLVQVSPKQYSEYVNNAVASPKSEAVVWEDIEKENE